jgi:membrane protease YdiL (CAAX protease family)
MNNVAATEIGKPTAGVGFARPIWVGIAVFLSYFGLILNGRLFRWFGEIPHTDAIVVTRELINLAMVGLIAWVVLKVEKRPLQSIGLHHRHWAKSLGWSLLVATACLGAAIILIVMMQALGVQYGDEKAFAGLSLWTVTLVTVRAGIAEEFMMRGYLLQRIEEWTGSTWMAVLLTWVPFALLHFPQGVPGVIISFVLGGILTAFYVWKRDLKSNIVAHFLVDFIANVAMPLIG